MGKLVGFDIGENSVKMVYFAGRELKRAITAELPDAMVSNGRILSMDAMADFIRDMAKGHGIPLTNAAMVLNTGDRFLPHGGVKELYRHCGIDAEGIAAYIIKNRNGKENSVG